LSRSRILIDCTSFTEVAPKLLAGKNASTHTRTRVRVCIVAIAFLHACGCVSLLYESTCMMHGLLAQTRAGAAAKSKWTSNFKVKDFVLGILLNTHAHRVGLRKKNENEKGSVRAGYTVFVLLMVLYCSDQRGALSISDSGRLNPDLIPSSSAVL
jgi:hypothetical protein